MGQLWTLLSVVVIGIGSLLLSANKSGATPLLAMQAASRCDTCHVMPDTRDPKWVEANYPLADRKCRATCGACHVNPAGGMLRTTEGQYFGTRILPLNTEVSPRVQKGLALAKDNGFLTIGGDFRFLDIITDQDDKKSPYFFPMQSDFYFDTRLAEHLALFSQFGLQRGGNTAVREAFGLVDRLPYNSYLKFGKFIPAYGHRLEDHTAFIRKELLVDQSNPVSYLSGVEVGANPLVFYGQFAYFNEDVRPQENNDKISTVYSGILGWQGLWLQLGGSFLRITDNRNWGEARTGQTLAGDRTAYGPYGAVNLWRLTWHFEYDWVENHLTGPNPDFDEFITYNELAVKIMKGITAKVRYETLDPDRDRDGDDLARVMVGLDFFPYPFTEINAQFRRNDTPAEDYYQILVMAHLWF